METYVPVHGEVQARQFDGSKKDAYEILEEVVALEVGLQVQVVDRYNSSGRSERELADLVVMAPGNVVRTYLAGDWVVIEGNGFPRLFTAADFGDVWEPKKKAAPRKAAAKKRSTKKKK